MHESPVSLKLLFISAIIALAVTLFLFLGTLLDTRTKIVFCDVGQGDGIYIRIRNQFDMLVDAGPNNSILTCLGKHMPFYDHQIELAILSHPDFDHYFGFIPLFDRYTVKTFFMAPLTRNTKTYLELLDKIAKKNTDVYFPQAGDSVSINDATLNFYWPTADFLHNKIRYPTNPSFQNNFRSQLGEPIGVTNEFSSIFMFEENNVRVLFTGDTISEILQQISPFLPISNDRKIDILKVPHHGSKYGLSPDFIKLADPTLSVISVGKKNRYGHPSEEVLKLLSTLGYKYVRTDEKGDIVYWIN